VVVTGERRKGSDQCAAADVNTTSLQARGRDAMADDALEAMALADASVHMYNLQHAHARLVFNVKRLIHLKVWRQDPTETSSFFQAQILLDHDLIV
jgi:hypothetical protein